jgi:hypothetical protein
LIRFFRYYKEERPAARNLQLVFMGNLSMTLPSAKDIRYLGFLDEDEKLAAMAAATALVIPSRLESLSIVALEALSVGTPILVSAGSKVLVEHCRKSNAGLYYSDYNEFEGILDVLAEDKTLIREMGKQGQGYIKESFGWEKLLVKYEQAFRASGRAPRPPAIQRQEREEKPVEEERTSKVDGVEEEGDQRPVEGEQPKQVETPPVEVETPVEPTPEETADSPVEPPPEEVPDSPVESAPEERTDSSAEPEHPSSTEPSGASEPAGTEEPLPSNEPERNQS